jgi:DNA polymerase-3 subunit delta'
LNSDYSLFGQGAHFVTISNMDSAVSSWDIIGHDWAVDLLRTAVLHGRIGHAYLLTGQAQVGKATLALTFAQALNCQSDYPESRPCGVCRPCQLIRAGRHPDVRHLVPEISGRGTPSIKIDQIRGLQKELTLGTIEARYKIALLEQFEAANASAANAFLKTLEEPPPNVILILTASEADALLPTISSRCRTLALRPLPTAVIENALLTRWQIPSDESRLLAHLANGRIGWAVQATQDPALLQTRQEQMTLLTTLLTGRRVPRFQAAEQLAKQAETLPDLLQTWLSWWRDLLVWQQGDGVPNPAVIINIDEVERLVAYAQEWSIEQVQTGLKQTNLALWQLARNANTRLVIENLLLSYPLPSAHQFSTTAVSSSV